MWDQLSRMMSLGEVQVGAETRRWRRNVSLETLIVMVEAVDEWVASFVELLC